MVKSIWKNKQSVLLIFRYINFKTEVCTYWFLLQKYYHIRGTLLSLILTPREWFDIYTEVQV